MKDQFVLNSVERAIGELRRGQVVSMMSGQQRVQAYAAEYVTDAALKAQHSTVLLITANRAKALGYTSNGAPIAIPLPEGTTADTVATLICGEADAGLVSSLPSSGEVNDACRKAALELAQYAELIPAMLVIQEEGDDFITVEAEAITGYDVALANTLEPVCTAPLTLTEASEAHITVFRSPYSGKEHYAITVGTLAKDVPPMVRIHASCYTGDLLASLKCDCRDQLQEAIRFMREQGGGIVLYLMQEGRGIGLANKLRAYALQAQGHDTVDANEILGFSEDARSYLPAAMMLKAMQVPEVRLMTNNPRKVAGLEQYGITVTERVAHIIAPHDHNETYLETKFSRLGHLKEPSNG